VKILVVNCGSSSIKYQLFDMPARQVLARGLVERIGEAGAVIEHQYEDHTRRLEGEIRNHEEGMALILESLIEPDGGALEAIDEIAAVGHRVVHGGEAFTGSVIIDEQVIASIEQMADLAPLHNPANLTGIRAALYELPDVPQVACFDTAFHTTIPPEAYLYALPYELYERYGIRRYGFHGTSHRYVARRAAERLGRPMEQLNCITCHLGNGSSMAAVRAGRSVDTSMGLTPLEGLVMGTRCGDIDPAVLFYLTDKGYDVAALNEMCNRRSGVLGVSGVSNDMRTVAAEAQRGNERAQLAIEIFCYRIRKYLGAYTAVLGEVHAVVFTGGIGENAVEVRARACEELEALGIEIDPRRNEEIVGREGAISTAASPVQVLAIPTNEEAEIAIDTYHLSRERLESHQPR
jgi:acetate kinase